MLCQKCKINNANVKIIRNLNGDVKEYFLCSSCAESEGMGLKPKLYKDIIPDSFFNILAPNTEATLVCTDCGLSYPEFKKNPRFGCVKCFDTFSGMLPNMIKDIQGAVAHTGKIPKRGGESLMKKKQISDKRAELSKAIAEENFELAAKLRDEIKALEQ